MKSFSLALSAARWPPGAGPFLLRTRTKFSFCVQGAYHVGKSPFTPGFFPRIRASSTTIKAWSPWMGICVSRVLVWEVSPHQTLGVGTGQETLSSV